LVSRLAVLELGLEAEVLSRQHLQEVVDRAEVVAGAEVGIRHAHDLVALLAEGRDARPDLLALRPESHVGVEGDVLGPGHRKRQPRSPAKRRLNVNRVVRDDHEGGPAERCLVDAVEAVRPHRAGRTARAHVVHHEQIRLVTEQLGQADLAEGRFECVVPHRLWLDAVLQGAHLLAQVLDSGALLQQRSLGFGVGHGFSSSRRMRCWARVSKDCCQYLA